MASESLLRTFALLTLHVVAQPTRAAPLPHGSSARDVIRGRSLVEPSIDSSWIGSKGRHWLRHRWLRLNGTDYLLAPPNRVDDHRSFAYFSARARRAEGAPMSRQEDVCVDAEHIPDELCVGGGPGSKSVSVPESIRQVDSLAAGRRIVFLGDSTMYHLSRAWGCLTPTAAKPLVTYPPRLLHVLRPLEGGYSNPNDPECLPKYRQRCVWDEPKKSLMEMWCCNSVLEALEAITEPIGVIVAGFSAHYFLIPPKLADNRTMYEPGAFETLMMRSHLEILFQTLEDFCATHGCNAAVRDASPQHFLSDCGDYSVESSDAMAHAEKPCQCRAPLKGHRDCGTQGGSVSAQDAYTQWARDVESRGGRDGRWQHTALWHFHDMAAPLHDQHFEIAYLELDGSPRSSNSADDTALGTKQHVARGAFSKSVKEWMMDHTIAPDAPAQERTLRDTAQGGFNIKAHLKCDCTHWCYTPSLYSKFADSVAAALRSGVTTLLPRAARHAGRHPRGSPRFYVTKALTKHQRDSAWKMGGSSTRKKGGP